MFVLFPSQFGQMRRQRIAFAIDNGDRTVVL
jgi:hypothetical protein